VNTWATWQLQPPRPQESWEVEVDSNSRTELQTTAEASAHHFLRLLGKKKYLFKKKNKNPLFCLFLPTTSYVCVDFAQLAEILKKVLSTLALYHVLLTCC
jgi:hypothetical protein